LRRDVTGAAPHDRKGLAMAHRQLPRALRSGLALILLATLAACGSGETAPKEKIEQPIGQPIGLLAVLPIQRELLADATDPSGRPLLEPGAESAVTAAVYDALATTSNWRFVADQTVSGVVRRFQSSTPIAERAEALGKAVNADGVLYGKVWRFQERVGADYGAKYPASVAFDLHLLSVATGKTVWSGTFDQTQQQLSSNMLNFWQFWEGGAKFFTVREFTLLGAKRLVQDMGKST
jgi:hypothetical protein